MRTSDWIPTTCRCGSPAKRARYTTNTSGNKYTKVFCTKCGDGRAKKYRANDPGKAKKKYREQNERRRENGYRRAYHVKKKYGLTMEQVDAIILLQSGTCAICPTSVTRNSHIDHDHISGKVRGVLCGRCNPAIGKMQDDPARLRRAADYIEKHRNL